ncbi:hypothetical protein CPB83DRAFT_846147 [Crepidotus variabilis]|uniref:Uncharacterized protein n=1 Tax=Crepidotus variabilis TaxID=179855 RepID=A0A9P6ENW4_9AGAR|nr:hypothetical protein CPB83DRAFT_846147 [Crepidotus variabilis]
MVDIRMLNRCPSWEYHLNWKEFLVQDCFLNSGPQVNENTFKHTSFSAMQRELRSTPE